MKKAIYLIIILISVNSVSAQNITIRSLKAYTSNEASLPVFTSEQEGITIEFDVEGEFLPNMNIVFRYCNKDWMPYENIFLQNHGQNIYYNIDVVRLPQTVEEAKYHFKGTFPDDNNYVSFPFSGKWRYYITDSQDTSTVYATGRFYVVYPDIELNISVKKALLEDKSYYPLELGRAFDITTSFSIPPEMFPAFVSETEIIENQKLDYPYIIQRDFNSSTRQFYWNANRDFSFTAKDVRPLNEYRQVDLRNHNVYIGKNVRAHFDGFEQSRFYKEGGRDLNGGSIIMNYRNEYATYLNVKFELKPPDNIMGDIFLVGSFNNWQLLPAFRMDKSGWVYSKNVLLKRGIYDYQYVTADVVNNEIINENWINLEGNFWETRNDYYIFVYYNDPDYGGYDRIIGYKKISGR